MNYLIIKAAATFLTFGHFSRAITVRAFPTMPTIIMAIVNIAAIVSNGRGNLKISLVTLIKTMYISNERLKKKKMRTKIILLHLLAKLIMIIREWWMRCGQTTQIGSLFVVSEAASFHSDTIWIHSVSEQMQNMYMIYE